MNHIKISVSIATSVILFCSFRLSDASFEGVWRGTSLCQVKNSPCHDETVVYRVSKSNQNTYTVLAYKIVDNQEEEMGTLHFNYNAANQTYLSRDSVRNAVWTFKIKENKLEGTLMLRGGLYRIINVSKQQ